MDHAFGDGDGRPVVEMPRRDGKLHDGKKGGNLHPTSVEHLGQISMRGAFVDVTGDDERVAEGGGRQCRRNRLLNVLPAQTEGRHLVDTNVLGRGRRVHLL